MKNPISDKKYIKWKIKIMDASFKLAITSLQSLDLNFWATILFDYEINSMLSENQVYSNCLEEMLIDY